MGFGVWGLGVWVDLASVTFPLYAETTRSQLELILDGGTLNLKP